MKGLSAIFLVFILCLGCKRQDKPSESKDNIFTKSTFEAEGVDKQSIDLLLRQVSEKEFGHVDRILLLKNGKLILDNLTQVDYKSISKGKSSSLGCGYQTCEDSTAFGEYNYYHPTWHPYYKNKEIHTLQSITKSISSLLIGIAIDQNKIPGTDALIIDYLTDYDLSRVEESLKRATLSHLLKMKLGMRWYEIGTPDTDPNNNTFALEQSEDWVQYTLNQPMDTLPDTDWVYNSGASQLMSVIIQKATGLDLDEYAKKYLFEPLGIIDYHWKRTPKGYPDALGGLYLKAEDLAKIGQLVLNKGLWGNQQLVSSEWIEESTSRLSDKTQVLDFGYGYQWWRPDLEGVNVIAGLGYGGQSLIIIPEFNLVGVTFSWNVFGNEFKDIRVSIIRSMVESQKLLIEEEK